MQQFYGFTWTLQQPAYGCLPDGSTCLVDARLQDLLLVSVLQGLFPGLLWWMKLVPKPDLQESLWAWSQHRFYYSSLLFFETFHRYQQAPVCGISNFTRSSCFPVGKVRVGKPRGVRSCSNMLESVQWSILQSTVQNYLRSTERNTSKYQIIDQ